MGRPKNEVVWNCFTKFGGKGAMCKYRKKNYQVANVIKTKCLFIYLLTCFKCHDDVRVQIRKYAAQSNFDKLSESAGSSSCSSAESGCSGPSSSKIARKGIDSNLIASIFSYSLYFKFVKRIERGISKSSLREWNAFEHRSTPIIMD